jgi:hypothetical protein
MSSYLKGGIFADMIKDFEMGDYSVSSSWTLNAITSVLTGNRFVIHREDSM